MFHDLSTCSCLRAAVNETFLTFTVHHISPSTIEKFSRNIAFLGSRLKIIFIGSRTCCQLYCTFTWCAITCQCIVIISDLFDLSIEIQISYRFIASLCIIKTESFSCPQPVVLLLLTKVGSPWGDRSILISGIQSCFILFEEIPFHLLCSCISRCSRFPWHSSCHQISILIKQIISCMTIGLDFQKTILCCKIAIFSSCFCGIFCTGGFCCVLILQVQITGSAVCVLICWCRFCHFCFCILSLILLFCTLRICCIFRYLRCFDSICCIFSYLSCIIPGITAVCLDFRRILSCLCLGCSALRCCLLTELIEIPLSDPIVFLGNDYTVYDLCSGCSCRCRICTTCIHCIFLRIRTVHRWIFQLSHISRIKVICRIFRRCFSNIRCLGNIRCLSNVRCLGDIRCLNRILRHYHFICTVVVFIRLRLLLISDFITEAVFWASACLCCLHIRAAQSRRSGFQSTTHAQCKAEHDCHNSSLHDNPSWSCCCK